MIVNIRGTSGSGKTRLVRDFSTMHGGMNALFGVDPTGNSTKEVILGYHTEDRRVGIPGRYTTACGGCDTIKTQDEAQRRVRWLALEYPNVVFEGLLISHIYARWAEMSLAYRPGFTFAFLDTPLDVCIDRVKARRERAGNTKELNTTNTIQKWHDSRRVMDRARADGHPVVWLPWEHAVEALEALLA